MKKYLYQPLVLIICAALLLSGCTKASETSPQSLTKETRITVQEVSMTDAVQAWRSSSAVIIDVRTPDEYRQGHIPGSILIPLSELEKRHDEIPKDKTVLIICRSGNRSAQANHLLLKLGYANTRSIQGGMLDWPERTEK